jgi:RNA polymerase sigma-70 factor (ECF subfamily)
MATHDSFRQLFIAGQQRWPGLAVPFEAFAGHCQRVLRSQDEQPLESADLFLCCACALGQPGAIRHFEGQTLGVAKSAIQRIEGNDDFVRDTLQELWQKLLVGADARVNAYSGRGPLQAWVRVAATRVALDRKRALRRGGRQQVELSERLAAPDVDLEASLLKARFGDAFQDALRAALAALSSQERNVLRMHVVGQCSIDEIGRAYDVHRATAARWIERSRTKVYDLVRDALCVRHKLTASEFHSLATLLGTHLQLSLSTAQLDVASATD